MSLFRFQVLQAQSAQRLSAVLVVVPRRLRWLIVGLLGITALGLCWLLGTPYQATVTVDGYTEAPAGIVPVHPSDSGRIVQVHVVDGQWVGAGAPLLTLEGALTRRVGPAGASARRRALSRALDELHGRHRDHVRFARNQLQRLDTRAANIGERLLLLERQRRLSSAALRPLAGRLDGLRELAARGLIARHEFEDRRRQQLAEEADLLALERAQLQLRATAEDVQGARAQALQELAARLRDYRETRDALRADLAGVLHGARTLIRAPARGQVNFLQAVPGALVAPGRPLLTLVPPMVRHDVSLLLPARGLGEIRVGQRVRLRYQAFPEDRFGTPSGRVTGLSRAPLLPSQVDAPLVIVEPVYRARIRLDDADPFSRPIAVGMPVKAEIVTRTASMGHWLLDPLRALRHAG